MEKLGRLGTILINDPFRRTLPPFCGAFYCIMHFRLSLIRITFVYSQLRVFLFPLFYLEHEGSFSRAAYFCRTVL